ncbi:MAG TPA: NapC/NirT family cytochrome c, partial [Methylomirabilota bacterium]
MPYARNAITVLGVFLTTISALLFLGFFLADLLGLHAGNPYLGIVFFLILPGVFLVGLALIPLGIVLARRRHLRGLPERIWEWPSLDLRRPATRWRVGLVFALTLVNVVIISLAAYRGVEYMDTPDFCGRVCHTVMEPEYTAYQDGPHSRVDCVQCHIGPGAPWFVKAKLDGVRQVWAVAV